MLQRALFTLAIALATATSASARLGEDHATEIDRSASGALVAITPTTDGVRHGLVRRWYESGQREAELLYWHGEKTGHHVTWWSNGHVRVDAHYDHDALTGEFLTYYQSGAPYERRHYINGREDGRQQSWTEAGELYLNYDARDGRRYGLVNAKPCVAVSDHSAGLK